jgi:hypothetical protein
MSAAAGGKFSIWKLLRTLLGLLLAPSVGGAIVMCGIALTERDSGDLTKALLIGGYIGLLLGGPGAILLGLPVHLLMWRQRWTSLWHYLGFGAVLGVAAYFGFGLAAGGVDIVYRGTN